MENSDKKTEKNNQLQLGLADADLILQFRRQTEERKFLKHEVLRIMILWWLSIDVDSQRAFYFASQEQLKKIFDESRKKGALPLPMMALLQRFEQLAQRLQEQSEAMPQKRARKSVESA